MCFMEICSTRRCPGTSEAWPYDLCLGELVNLSMEVIIYVAQLVTFALKQQQSSLVPYWSHHCKLMEENTRSGVRRYACRRCHDSNQNTSSAPGGGASGSAQNPRWIGVGILGSGPPGLHRLSEGGRETNLDGIVAFLEADDGEGDDLVVGLEEAHHPELRCHYTDAVLHAHRHDSEWLRRQVRRRF
ncbi:hypothetical protein TIFTF001_020647 [Ficus carica]|uniref:Uncharacterized protein n=1 Tax=Ficus carica TaxID=3494 RepID=A0AA88D9Z5_FICCA|nr:hypothetical protein TIFTF001_020647 [Ficus carica]